MRAKCASEAAFERLKRRSKGKPICMSKVRRGVYIIEWSVIIPHGLSGNSHFGGAQVCLLRGWTRRSGSQREPFSTIRRVGLSRCDKPARVQQARHFARQPRETPLIAKAIGGCALSWTGPIQGLLWWELKKNALFERFFHFCHQGDTVCHPIHSRVATIPAGIGRWSSSYPALTLSQSGFQRE